MGSSSNYNFQMVAGGRECLSIRLQRPTERACSLFVLACDPASRKRYVRYQLGFCASVKPSTRGSAKIVTLVGAGFKPALPRRTQDTRRHKIAMLEGGRSRSLSMHSGPLDGANIRRCRLPRKGGFETRPYKHHGFCVTSHRRFVARKRNLTSRRGGCAPRRRAVVRARSAGATQQS